MAIFYHARIRKRELQRVIKASAAAFEPITTGLRRRKVFAPTASKRIAIHE